MKVSSLICAPISLLISFSLIYGQQRPVRPLPAVEDGFRPEVSGINRIESRPGTPALQTGTPFSSKEGRFSVTIPQGFDAFQHQAKTQATGVGNIELHIYSSETPRGACMLSYSDFPSASFEGRSVQKILEDGRDGALKSVSGTLEEQKSITVQGHPGLSVLGWASAGGKQIYFRTDFVLVQPRAYQIMYLAYDKADLVKPAIQDYFKSFRLQE